MNPQGIILQFPSGKSPVIRNSYEYSSGSPLCIPKEIPSEIPKGVSGFYLKISAENPPERRTGISPRSHQRFL